MTSKTQTPAPSAAELHARIQDFRRKIVRNEPVTDDELRAALRDLHAYRLGASTTLENAIEKTNRKSAASKKKAADKQAAQNLLGDLL